MCTYVTHTPILHGVWTAFDSTPRSPQVLIYDTRLCWHSCCRVPQIFSHTKEMVHWYYSCPGIRLLTPLSPTTSLFSLGLSCTSFSQPFPFLWLPEVCTMYLQAFSSWKILTNRKFSYFPGWKPNLCIRNACPYFQFSPFSAIPPLLSGNAQLRLSGL